MQNLYLVVLRCTMDELPIKLFTDEHFAVMHAEILGRQLEALGDGDPLPAEVGRVEEILGLDASSLHSVCVYVFEDGVLRSWRLVADLT